jgi:hypothetical protein
MQLKIKEYLQQNGRISVKFDNSVKTVKLQQASEFCDIELPTIKT